VPRPEDDDYEDRINEICSSENIDVVLPQTTRETAKLSKIQQRINAEVIVADALSIERANNKYDLSKLCHELDIPFPMSLLVKSPDNLKKAVEKFGYPSKPVVVKPPVSFGSRGFRVIREGSSWTAKRFLSEKPNASEITLEELLEILERDKSSDFPELVVSEYLPGSEYSVDAFVGRKVQVAIPRLRKEIVNGISFRTTLDYRSDIMENTLKAANALGLKYAFGFQFKLDNEGVPKVLECNPRVQGTMVASLFSGVNVIWMSVRESIHQPVETVPKVLQKSEFFRYWGGIGTTDAGFGEI